MASLLSISSIVGAACRQSPSADCHLHNNVLTFCNDFDARRQSFCRARGDMFATHCCSPFGVVSIRRISLWAPVTRGQSGFRWGASGWGEAPFARADNGRAAWDANRVKVFEESHQSNDEALRATRDCKDGELDCLSNRVLKLDEICTPLTLLVTSVSTSPDFDRLLVGSPREFWIVHVLLSGLVPTLVGWQLLQYSCGLLDGWLQPTKYRSLDARSYRPQVIGGIKWQRDENRFRGAGVLLVKTFQSEAILSLDSANECQKTVTQLSSKLEFPPFLRLLQRLKDEFASFPCRLAVSVDCQGRSRWPTFSDDRPPFVLWCLDVTYLLQVVSRLKGKSRNLAEDKSEKFWTPGNTLLIWKSNVAIRWLESWLRCIRGRAHNGWDDFQRTALKTSTIFYNTEPMLKLVRRSPLTAVAQASSQTVVCSYLWDMGFLSWLKRISVTYGTSFVGLIVMGYWIQGFRSFPWLAVSFLFKDGLQVDPATMQFILSSASLPMVAKPVYGIMSDTLFIGGCHRLPYLAIAASLQALSWGAIIMNPGATASLGLLTVLLAVSNLGAAIAEVMNDALVAEAGKKDPNSTGELQSLAWIALATGGVLGSLCGGLALKRIDCHTMFSIFLLMVIAQLIVCFTVSERSFGLGGTRREESPVAPPVRESGSGLSLSKIKVLGVHLNFQKNEKIALAQLDSNQASRRVVGVGDDVANLGVGRVDFTGVSRVGGGAVNLEGGAFEMKFKSEGGDHVDGTDCNGQLTFAKATFLGRPSSIDMMRQQFSMLMELIRKPEVVRPLLWFVASYALTPTLGSSLFFFQTQELHIDPAFLGIQKVVGQLGLMAGSVLFNRYLKQLPLRKVVAYVQCLLCFCMLSDFLLVSRVNVLLGIRDEFFVLGVSAFVEAVAQFKILPFMVLLARLCPAGSEGSLLAFFMSAHCLANTFSAYLGVALASYLQITSNSFTYLPLGIFVQAMAALVPVTLVGLIPDDPRTPPRLTKVEKKVL